VKFKIHAARRRNGADETTVFQYDNMTSELLDARGERIFDVRRTEALKDWTFEDAPITSPGDPLGKSETLIRDLKIQLGLSCNYSCDYCSQRFVPHADNGTPEQVEKFMRNLDSWLKNVPEKIEFWGGEPFVYWKTLRPLAEALRAKFPTTEFVTITNGSLLSPEINDWLVALDFRVGISHDGPGQPVRGPDPLADPKQREHILDLWERLYPLGHISFNSMVHRENMDRAAIQKYFEDLLGVEKFKLGEGGFIDTYDEGGMQNTVGSAAEHLGFRRLTLEQTRARANLKLDAVSKRIEEWMNSISVMRPASALGQKCGMDRLDTMAVDLRGNVLTCQNVSAVSVAPNGRSHLIGHVSRMKDVKLRTSTHWSKRKNCSDCPILQACKGSCMFLEDEYWDKSCNSAYSDHVPFFAVAIERMTGFLPFYIESEGYLPEDRKNIWGTPQAEAVVPPARQPEKESAAA